MSVKIIKPATKEIIRFKCPCCNATIGREIELGQDQLVTTCFLCKAELEWTRDKE